MMFSNISYKPLALILAIAVMFAQASMGFAQVVTMPAGNQNAAQPAISSSSISRTNKSKSSFEAKYQKIRNLIARDKKLQSAIKKSASRFDIEPIHIIGALVGEHTYNVDAYDQLQTYLVKAASYFDSAIKFQNDGEHVLDFIKRPQFEECKKFKDSYQLWHCRETVWKTKFSGKTVDGKTWPKDRFGRVFFQPLYAGQTFGLGQLNPLAALRVDDFVVSKTKSRPLNAKDAPKVYKAIMNPNSTLDYMAAILKTSINSYKDIAGVDISTNPGITATLYNLGGIIDRAQALKLKRKSDPKILPKENYYGWLVNDKLSELSEFIK